VGLHAQPRVRISITRQFPSHGVAEEEAVLRDPARPSLGMQTFHRIEYEATSVDEQDIDGEDLAFYAQDSWRVAERLTVGAGVRVDFLRDQERTSGAVTRRSAAIGPRVSVSYALPSGGLVRGGWGRVHESSWAGRYSGPLPTVGTHRRYDLDLDGTFETDYYTPASTSISTLRPQVDRTPPHVDEWTAGFRQPLPRDVTAEVGVVRRAFRAMPISYDVDAVYVGGVFQGYANGPYSQTWVYTANRWYTPVVTDLTFQASRQTPRSHLLASYTRNWRHVAGTWVPTDPAAFLQPTAFPNDAGIGLTSGSTSDSLSGNADTSNPAWADHSVRIAGVYRAARGLLLAGRYQVQSGEWSGPVVTRIAAPDLSHGPEVVMQDGVAIPNPLATTLRFANATRGEGQLQLPAVHEISVRAGYRFDLGRGVRLDAALDVFNPLNRSAFVSFAPTANQTYSPVFGQGLGRQSPRAAQVSVRVGF
jgi:hypothetical protein